MPPVTPPGDIPASATLIALGVMAALTGRRNAASPLDQGRGGIPNADYLEKMSGWAFVAGLAVTSVGHHAPDVLLNWRQKRLFAWAGATLSQVAHIRSTFRVRDTDKRDSLGKFTCSESDLAELRRVLAGRDPYEALPDIKHQLFRDIIEVLQKEGHHAVRLEFVDD